MHILKCNFDGCASFLFKSTEDDLKWGKGWFDGVSKGVAYPVPEGVRNVAGPENRSDIMPDFTHIGLAPIPTFSMRAIQALGSMLSEHGELAPIKMDEPVQYYGFNPTIILDLLDEDQSQITYFSSGKIMAIDHYVLRKTGIRLPPIFKIPQTRVNKTYVSDEFIARVNECKLTGFRFQPLP